MVYSDWNVNFFSFWSLNDNNLTKVIIWRELTKKWSTSHLYQIPLSTNITHRKVLNKLRCWFICIRSRVGLLSYQNVRWHRKKYLMPYAGHCNTVFFSDIFGDETLCLLICRHTYVWFFYWLFFNICNFMNRKTE